MDESSRKRESIGLSPRRPTAQAAPMRPPEEASRSRLKAWTLVGLVAAIVVGTSLLVLARITGSPTDWPSAVAGLSGRPAAVSAEITGSAGGMDAASQGTALPGSDTLGDEIDDEIDDETGGATGDATIYDFAAADSLIPPAERAGEYTMTHMPDAGVYRVQIEPGNVAWVVPGPACSSPYRLVTGTVLDPATPDGHVGLLGRYQDDGNFYLFAIDGQGNYAVLLLQDGVWQPVQAGTHESIRPAGERNILALGDDGTTMVFVVNGEPLYRVDLPQLPLGMAGFGGRAGERVAQIDITGVELMSACQ